MVKTEGRYTALYERLSRDDEIQGTSNSILNQKKYLEDKELAFNPAVELSYLKPHEQEQFLDAMDYAQATPSLSQAQRLKRLSQNGQCTLEAMYEIMDEEKKSELDRITIRGDVLRKYFPKSYTPLQMQETIIKLLEAWQKNRAHQQER